MPMVNSESQDLDEAAERCFAVARAIARARCSNSAMGEQAAAEYAVGAREIIYALRDFGTSLDLLHALCEHVDGAAGLEEEMKPIQKYCDCGFAQHLQWYEFLRCRYWGRIRRDSVRQLFREMRSGKMDGQDQW